MIHGFIGKKVVDGQFFSGRSSLFLLRDYFLTYFPQTCDHNILTCDHLKLTYVPCMGMSCD